MDRRAFVLATASLASLPVFTAPALAAVDKGAFEALVKEVIRAAVSKSVNDPDALAAKMEAAAKIGVEFSKAAATAEPSNKAIIEFVIANFDKIKNTPIADFEEQWHDGAAFKAAGHDYSKLDQAGKSASALDAIIHPLTARAALIAYKTDKKDEHLKTVVTELEEVLGHLKHL